MTDRPSPKSTVLLNWLNGLSRGQKRLVMLTADTVAMPVALWCAFALQFSDPVPDVATVWWLFPLAIVSAVPVFIRLGLYRAVIRFMGARVLASVTIGVFVSVLVLAAATALSGAGGVPQSVFVIYWALALIFVGGGRFLAHGLFQRRMSPGRRVAIYGAGRAGARLSAVLTGGQEFLPVAFLDDNRSLHGSHVNGITVYPPGSLPELIEQLDLDSVLLAIPSVSGRRRHEIIRRLEPLPVHVQTMPNYADLISGVSRLDEIREIDVEDLLGRDTVPPATELLERCLGDKRVMLTGAGGSIGSELCRQILLLRPRLIVLLEISEPALYKVERELCLLAGARGIETEVVAILGSAQDRARVLDVMQTFGVQIVYHAAAYKHVPIVEQNMLAGVHNNIFATFETAQAAIAAKVETFVLVSTDKAVAPTSVMGATKRFAELVLQGLQQRGTKTRFCIVRFGNVLASSGSVVPVFREQIRKGGPVTVTHPEIIRYFMTIPEAAQLVLQAGSMGTGGDVFVLDMGEPVRIADLARRMIKLAGLTVREPDKPQGDIAITYTGLRPAEKLYEELLIGDNAAGTEHAMIMRAEEAALPWDQVRHYLGQLRDAAEAFDCERTRGLLLEAVSGFRTAPVIEDLVYRRKSGPAAAATPENVTRLRPGRR